MFWHKKMIFLLHLAKLSEMKTQKQYVKPNVHVLLIELAN